MQAATIKMPRPASRQLRGLQPPNRAARTAGNPKMPAPRMELTISAVKLQRPITLTRTTGELTDTSGAAATSVSGKYNSGFSLHWSVFGQGHRRRFHCRDFCQYIRLGGDAFKMRITFASVIIDTHRLEIILIVEEQLDRLLGIFCMAYCFA